MILQFHYTYQYFTEYGDPSLGAIKIGETISMQPQCFLKYSAFRTRPILNIYYRQVAGDFCNVFFLYMSGICMPFYMLFENLTPGYLTVNEINTWNSQKVKRVFKTKLILDCSFSKRSLSAKTPSRTCLKFCLSPVENLATEYDF